MRVLPFALAGLFCLQDPAPPDDAVARKAERIRQAVEWLCDADPDVRAMGVARARELGKDALPAVERRLEEKGLLDLARALRELDRPAGEDWVRAEDLRDLPAPDARQPDPKSVDAYVRARYEEALSAVKAKHYQRGYDVANALVILEPRSPHAEKIRLLRRHCDAMITQTTLIEAKVIQPRVWYVEGEPIELSLRMRNIFSQPISLTWGPAGGLAVIKIELTMGEMLGSSSTEQRHQEMSWEAEVPIAPGAQWERKFALDDSATIKDRESIRIFTVDALTQPLKIDMNGRDITRRLQFESAVVKVLPKKYAIFRENPLEWLGKTMDTGTVQEVYVCSQMLEGDQKVQGAVMLVRWMEKAEKDAGRIAAAHILTALTGQKLGMNPLKWSAWLQDPGSDKMDKKPK